MEISHQADIHKLSQLFKTPKASIEKEFSPYFYRYFIRYFKSPKKFNGYLTLCQYLFRITQAKDAAVLDLGCGFGILSTIFGLYGSKEVVGYDLNTEKIEIFEKLLFYLDSRVRNVKPVLGDSSRIGYPDEYFDVAVANDTLSHVRDLGKSMHEICRVLKRGGRLLIRDGNNSLFLLGRIRRRMFWKRIEHGPVDPLSFRSTDIPLPYFEVRRRMILERLPQMDLERVNLLAKETAGMYGNEIFEAIKELQENGKISNRPRFRYRNPVTGEFPERELNPFSLKRMLQKMGFEVSFIPHYYSTSFIDLENAVKRFFHWVERMIPVFHLFLTPGFALLSRKLQKIDYLQKGWKNRKDSGG